MVWGHRRHRDWVVGLVLMGKGLDDLRTTCVECCVLSWVDSGNRLAAALGSCRAGGCLDDRTDRCRRYRGNNSGSGGLGVLSFVVFLNASSHDLSSSPSMSCLPSPQPQKEKARQMTMDARDKETTSTYRPENTQQQSYRIESYRLGAAEQEKVNRLV